MKKTIWAVILILVLILGYWLISPFFINKEVSESLPASQEDKSSIQTVVLKQGSFTGFDKIHNGSGTATLLSVNGKNYIRFEDNFTVNNGPDLYVGLGKNGQYIKGSEVGVLKGNIGSQNYELPENIDPASVDEVWVWCKAFSVPFAKAELN